MPVQDKLTNMIVVVVPVLKKIKITSFVYNQTNMPPLCLEVKEIWTLESYPLGSYIK